MKTFIFAITIMVLIYFSEQVRAQELLSSTYNSDYGTFTYELGVPEVSGFNDPFVAGSWKMDNNDWVKIPVQSNGNGQYVFTITTYDSPIGMYYGDFQKPNNTKLKKLIFYKPNDGKVARFFLGGGKIYDVDQYSYVAPAKEGNNIIRYEIFGDSSRIFVNLQKMPREPWTLPFAITSATGWWENEIPLKIATDGSGWASFVVCIKDNENENDPGNIGVGYGAKLNGEKIWPNIFDTDDKTYINSKNDGLIVPEKYRNH